MIAIDIKHDIGSDTSFLLAELRWDDRDPLSAEATALICPVLQEVNAFWDSESEFRETRRQRSCWAVWTD